MQTSSPPTVRAERNHAPPQCSEGVRSCYQMGRVMGTLAVSCSSFSPPECQYAQWLSYSGQQMLYWFLFVEVKRRLRCGTACLEPHLPSKALATFTCTVIVLGNFKFGTVEVSELRPTNNDAGSHAVKLQAQTTSRSDCRC